VPEGLSGSGEAESKGEIADDSDTLSKLHLSQVNLQPAPARADRTGDFDPISSRHPADSSEDPLRFS
jgi:hypothetical protein